MSRAVRRKIAARRAIERAERRQRDRLAHAFAATREHVVFDDAGNMMLQAIDPDRFAAALERYERDPPTGDDEYECCPLCRALAEAADGPPSPFSAEREAGEDLAEALVASARDDDLEDRAA